MINIQSSNPLLRKSGAEKKQSTHTNVNAASLYKQNNINTASPEELTMMLYDGAVKFCSMAIAALEKNDLEGCNRNVVKVKNIIVEFRSTLDFQYEVSNDFDRIYDYIYWVLSQANMKKDKSLLEEALKRLREMRDTWRELMKAAKESKPEEELAEEKIKKE